MVRVCMTKWLAAESIEKLRDEVREQQKSIEENT